MGAPALKAALRYATALHWHVLPVWWLDEGGRCACGKPDCTSPGKHPLAALAPNGLDDATTDGRVIRRWFEDFPRANLAARTGPESNLLVVDVDDAVGEKSLVELEHRHGYLPDGAPMQRTGGGAGWQLFLAFPHGRAVGNTVQRLGPKLDTRGNRGYVLLPPSITRQAYRWELDRSPWDLPPEPPPGWLVDLLDPPPAPEPPRPDWHGAAAPIRGSAYAIKALRSELALAAVAPRGRRNAQLNASAYALMRLCADGALDPGVVARGLRDAAGHAGLPDAEALRTIASAARARGVPLP